MINTLEVSKHLHKSGFSTKQSEALAQEWYKINDAQLDKLATKEQVNALDAKSATKDQVSLINMKLNLVMGALALLLAVPSINSWIQEGLKLISK